MIPGEYKLAEGDVIANEAAAKSNWKSPTPATAPSRSAPISIFLK